LFHDLVATGDKVIKTLKDAKRLNMLERGLLLSDEIRSVIDSKHSDDQKIEFLEALEDAVKKIR